MVKVASYAGSLDRALAVLDDMDSAGMAPTPAVWGSLLVACGKVHSLCQPHRLEAIRLQTSKAGNWHRGWLCLSTADAPL